ncbi:MAG: potassium transporter Kup [Candidatus Sericytochromatia bacterium]
MSDEQNLQNHQETHHKLGIWTLAFGALGVVYGDIGTSPLYALKECFHGNHAINLNEANIFGVLSLAMWSLMLVVTFKYLLYIMRADNHGEGGIFSLLALVPSDTKLVNPKVRNLILLAAMFGASLLYGDGVITPAISVLSAVEGLEVATSAAKNLTVPITCIILLALFFIQKYGTEKIGQIFGPIMLIWFFALAVSGLIPIIKEPHVLTAINPMYAIDFFKLNGYHAFVVLGSVVLCITGGEALYADMGHFGRKPIQLSWFTFVFPALILNYFGQGALLLHNPEAASNPFFGLIPKTLIYPSVFLATAATIIASQALISGAFSLTQQAIQMGFLPRLDIIHTSGGSKGQIYIPLINKLLMIFCLGIVLVFKNSENLAAAYGLAVTANMILTSLVFFFVATKNWGWSIAKTGLIVGIFLFFDIMYFSSNMLKFFDGGWLPFIIAVSILSIMLTWKRGRQELYKQIRVMKLPFNTNNLKNKDTSQLNNLETDLSYQEKIEQLNALDKPTEELIPKVVSISLMRIPGTAVFMTLSPKGLPTVMLHHLKHNKVLHERVIFLSILSADVPIIKQENRIQIKEMNNGFYRVIANYGFMETPNVTELMRILKDKYMNSINLDETTYYLGREVLIVSNKTKMFNLSKHLFTFISRNAQSVPSYFNIPTTRVVELGMQVEL